MPKDLTKILCTQMKGVGPKTATRLEKINLNTAQDLLFHLPLRYEDRTRVLPIRELRLGESAGIIGTIEHTEIVRFPRSMFICHLRDITGIVQLRFFHFGRQKIQFQLKPGIRIYCYGELRLSGANYEMVHPEYKILKPGETPPLTTTLTPIYPSTEGLPQFVLRQLVDQALKILEKNLPLVEYLPAEILSELHFVDLTSAIKFIHQPPPHSDLNVITNREHPMRRRLIFEELLAQQLSLLRLRQQTKAYPAPKLSWNHALAETFQAKLPFSLTNAQKKVLAEIAEDLAKPKPMLRLLQGDVGCGKTIVAALAILQAVQHGYQAAIMAPTEILAEQHHKNISAWLEPFNVKTILLTGKIKGKTRRITTKTIADAATQVIIGTHAIFQEKIKFAHLALIIIDEQHRFGVHQRLRLREKGLKDGEYPHQLIMTATPIPRTLAMTIYADLDCSVIDELPKGRTAIKTVVVPNIRRQEVLAHVRVNCQQGKQAYWVCALIEESELLQCQAAETLARDLTVALPELKVGLVHGRMSSQQKDEIMAAFKNGQIDLLVATTVIEVGVDVPNASLMIIENTERLGLVQLHQLRGRIGRGTIASHCVLLYQAPLSHQAEQRLLLLRDSNDGFVLARKDLEMRGPGEVLGTKQTGLLELKIADIIKDQHLIPQVQQVAVTILEHHQEIVNPLITRWLGKKARYGEIV